MIYKSDIHKVLRVENAEEFPGVFIIDNINACNLKCSICDHKNMIKYRKVEKLPFDLYIKIIDEIAKENPKARVWEIFFGDPFLCSDMPFRIKYAKDKGLTDVVLNTNGVLMEAEKSKQLIIAGLDAMYVGIDAYKEETYNKIRVGGNFKRVIENVLQYSELIKKYGNPEKQKIYVQYVVDEINQDEVEDFKNFWIKNKINVKIRPKVSWAGLVEAKNLVDNSQLEIRKPCYWLIQTMNICSNGEVCLCSVDVHCKVKCGNVREKSIKEIWSGKLKEYRKMHSENRYNELPEICRNCRDWQSTYAEFVN